LRVRATIPGGNVTPRELEIKADSEGSGAILRLKLKRRQQKIIRACGGDGQTALFCARSAR